jgi:hypothetical protein
LNDRDLPLPPGEVPVQSDTAVLAPRFRDAVARVVDDMRAWGYTPLVFEALRTNERQAFLHGFGRDYDDGRGIVTHSQTADDTWHGYGLAVDIVCSRRRWSAAPDFWHVLGTSARRHGLVWGGDWNGDWSITDEKFMDRPHIQWGAMRRSPSARAVELRKQGGLVAVWSTVSAL